MPKLTEVRLTLLITISPLKELEARLRVLSVGWVKRVVGIGPVRLLDAALMLARAGRVSNRSGREVRAFPDMSLFVSSCPLECKRDHSQPEQSVE